MYSKLEKRTESTDWKMLKYNNRGLIKRKCKSYNTENVKGLSWTSVSAKFGHSPVFSDYIWDMLRQC